MRLLLAALFLLSVGCTKGGKTPEDTLVVAMAAQPSTLDPRFALDAGGMRISALIFDSLVRIGPNLDVVPAAAESWTYDKDTYTLKVRPGLKFSNGRPLNKEDIEFSFEQFRAPGSPFASAFEAIDSVTVLEENGALQVKIKMKYFSSKFLKADLSAIKLLPKAETLAAGQDFGRKVLGTGPYKLVRQDLNEIELAAVPDHPVKSPKTPKLVFKIIRDDYTRFQKTLKGDIDIAQSELPVDKIGEFEKKSDRFNVIRFPGIAMTYLLVNFKDPVLSQKKVRYALAESLKRQEIIQFKLQGLATEATSILTPNNPFFNADLKYPPFNLEGAQKAIAELGLKGKTLILKASNNPQALDNAKVIANQLSQSGLKIELQSFEWGTFFDDIKKGNFQLATMKWVATLDPDIYRLAFHSSEKPPGRNRGSYENKSLDPLLEQSFRIENEAKRKAAYMNIQKIVFDDMPIIPLWYEHQVAVTKKNIQGYEPSQMGDYVGLVDVSKTKE